MRISQLLAVLLLILPTSHAIAGGQGKSNGNGNGKSNGNGNGIGNGKKKILKVKGCKNSKCQLDDSDFSDFADADFIEVQLKEGGPQKTFKRNRGNGVQSWHGEEGFASMNLLKRARKGPGGKDLLFGSVADKDVVYQISPDEFGNSEVKAIPLEDFPPEADPVEILDTETTEKADHNIFQAFKSQDKQHREVSSTSPTSSLRGNSDKSHRALYDDNGGNIDVMVVWTAKSECANSGLSVGCTLTSTTSENMRGLIDLAIAETNTAYDLSGVLTELRLVHAYRHPTYVETGFGTALSDLRGTEDNIMDDVHTKRNVTGADVVALLIDDPSYCGMAYLGPSIEKMFSVTKWSCATGYYSFGHEIGHNMGCNHDKGTTNTCGSPNYNYGWRDPNANFRTILAYSCVSGQCDNNPGGGCTRIQRFSTPNYLYNGEALGSAEHDNARRINDVRATIAAYFPVVPDCTGDPDCDDGDACTDDTCNVETGDCVFTYTCPTNPPTAQPTAAPSTSMQPTIDADELETTFAGGNGQAGNMFDVIAKKSLAVRELSIHTSSIASVEVKIYTRQGNYVIGSSGWNLIQQVTVSGKGLGNRTPLPPLDTPVPISAGSTQAFYVTLTTADIKYTTGTTEGSIFAENEDLSILEGRGVAYEFGSTFFPRVWNGVIKYDLSSEPPSPSTPAPPTNAPTTPQTLGPSSSPSRSPSRSPTFGPTPSPTVATTPSPSEKIAIPIPPTSMPTPIPTLAPITSNPTTSPPQPTKQPTDSPTPAPPSSQPTKSPTKQPTPSPTANPTSQANCVDDPDFKVDKNGRGADFDCNWVAQNPRQRCDTSGTSGIDGSTTASVACPSVCNNNCYYDANAVSTQRRKKTNGNGRWKK